MRSLLDDRELEKISAYIAAQMGLSFPPSKWRNLEQSFCTAARELGFRDLQECVARFTSTPPSKELIESMACYLTIGETYFLREIRCYEILEQQIIPEIIKKRQGGEQRLRIWSAGCATGEEAYSIAILLHRMRDTLRGWSLSILATDINPHALRKAREGVYTGLSFRNTPESFKESYFRKTGEGRFELLPRIKEMVMFSSINLAEDCYPSLVTDTNAIDVIFCRNVLMYFTPQLAAKVVERFKLCLLDGGWLFVSPCETSQFLSSRFATVNYPDATVYRKLGIGETENRRIGEELKNEIGETEKVGMVTMQLMQDKSDTQALALLCRIYANEGRLAEALNASDLALAADKLSAGLHYLRAVILQEQGMYDESAASLKKALYLDQDLVLAHFTLANLEQRKGRGKESQRYFNNALSLLDRYRPDDVIPESDGMLAGRLKEIIRAATGRI